jgi:hypothetical protein
MSKRRKKALLKMPKLSKQQKIWIGVGAGVLVAVVVFGRKRIAPGLLTLSFLGDAIQPRGIRNNNPGNILLTSEPWDGKLSKEQNTDGKFEQFKSYAYGVRAMIVLLRNYFSTYKLDNLEAIVYRWNQGNPNYVKYVAEKSGIAPTAKITANKETIKKLVQGIADFENGIKPNERTVVSDDVFEAAWSIL